MAYLFSTLNWDTQYPFFKHKEIKSYKQKEVFVLSFLVFILRQDLIVQPKLASNSLPSLHLSLPSVEITGVSWHAQMPKQPLDSITAPSEPGARHIFFL